MARKGKIGPVIAVDGETEFKKSIKSINDNLGVLTSELKKVDAEFGKNETSIEGARSKIEIYRKQLEQLSQKEKMQSQALQDAQKRYSEAGDKVSELKNKLASAEKEMDELKNSSDATTAEIKEQAAIIKDLEKDLKNAERQYASAEKSTKGWQKALNNTQAEIATSRRDMEQLAASTIKTKEAFEAAEKRLETWQSKLGKMGNALTIGVTAPLVTAGAGMFKAAEDFETAFAGVTKTVDGTEGEISGLRQGIIDMAKEIPSSTTEISAVAEAAGQLGIQVPNILGFTRTMIDLGNSTNISAEEAASSLAKFANVTNMSQEDFDRLGSAIVDLGNNFATTEADIVAMATRLSGAGAQIGLSEGEILGFATALSSVGIEAEMGGSAFSKAMVAMQVACETGLGPVKQLTEKTGMSLRDLQLMSENSSKDFTALADSLGMTKSELQNMVDAGSDLEGFAEIAGMTADQFQKAFREDAAGAIEAFIKGLGDTENKSESTIVMLENLGFTEVRLRDTMTRLANSGDLVTKAVDMGNAAWDENVALTEEAGKRYETTESKLKIAKNQITDAARIMGENMLPVVGNLAEDLSKLTDKFSALSPETQKTIIKLAAAAAAIGPVTKGLSGMTGAAKAAVGGVKNLVTALSKQTAVKKAADGLTGVASAATSVAGATAGAGSGVTGFAGILSKLASPTGAAVAAAGAVLAIGAAAWKAHEDMVKADIAAHFGDIELAAEEVEDVATRLTTTDWTMRINTYMDAKEKLGTYEENIQSAISEMNKLDWKVSVGLELTDDEKRAYAESLDTFAQNCQQYIEEKGYVINLAISAGFDAGSPTGESLSAWADAYYASASDEVAELKRKLDKLMEESLINGTWDENKEKMDELRQKISSVYQRIVTDASSAEYEGVISDFRVTIGNIDMGDLTQESFNQVNEQIAEYTQKLQDYADGNKQDVMLTITTRYSDNIRAGMPEATARQIMEDSIKELEFTLQKNKGEVIVQGIDFSFDAIKDNFSYRVDEAKQDLDRDFDSIKQYFLNSFTTTDPRVVSQTALLNNAGADKAVRKAIKKALEPLEPQKEQLEKIADSYLEAGKAVPENIVKGLTDIYEMSALSGKTNDLYKLWAKEIADSPERMKALAEAQKSGREIPEGVIEAVEMYSGKIYNAVTGMWEEPVEATRENIQPILEYLNKSGLDCGDEAAKGLAASYGLIYDAASKTWIAVSDATLDSKENIKSVVEQCGLEVTDELIATIQLRNDPTKQQMLILLQQLVAATDEQRETILLKLFELGVDVSGSLSKGMMSNYSFVESSTAGMIDVIDKTSGEKIVTLKQSMAERLVDAVGGAIDYVNNQTTQKGPQLDPPTIKEFDPTKLDTWADKTMWALQRSLEGHGTLTVPVKTVASPGDRPIAGYADGGRITEEGLYWGAEGDKPEYVIPTDPAKRQRAISLYSQAGKELGIIPESAYTPPTLPVQPSGAQLDYTKLAKAIAAELRSAPVETSVSINVQEGGVYLDNELVGRQQAPVISRIQAKHI